MDGPGMQISIQHASNRANSFLWSAADEALQHANLNPAQ